MRFPILAGLATAGLLAATVPARAQADAETRQLIERLRPSGDAQTRGIRVPNADLGPASPAPAPEAQPPTAPPAPQQAQRDTTAPAGAPAVSITVNFTSGSAVLNGKSAQSLDALGRALGSRELAAYVFRIEGHTDTVGDAAQNEQLSRRRAEAVRDYLVKRHGVPAARLNAVGLGESQLLVPTPDQVPEPRNRRVQVVNTGS